MKLKDYLSKTGKTQSDMAASINANQGFFNQWVHGVRPVPVHYAVAIEKKTDGAVSRRDLRPDWAAIWPDLTADAIIASGSTGSVANTQAEQQEQEVA